MQVLEKRCGVLNVDVASEGNYLRKGTQVVVSRVVDNFKNIVVLVQGTTRTVRLNAMDTDFDWIVK